MRFLLVVALALLVLYLLNRYTTAGQWLFVLKGSSSPDRSKLPWEA